MFHMTHNIMHTIKVISLGLFSIVCSYARIRLPNCIFPTQMYVSVVSPMRATCLSHRMPHYSIIQKIFGEEQKWFIITLLFDAVRIFFRSLTEVGSEVLTVVVMKSSIFWDITPCRIWGSHSCGYEEFYLLGYDAMQSVDYTASYPRRLALHGTRNPVAVFTRVGHYSLARARWNHSTQTHLLL
jgi:hypothetical protein